MMNEQESKLLAKLKEDVEDEETAVALFPLVNQLTQWPSPQPTAKETQKLVAQTAAALPNILPKSTWRARAQWAYWLLRAQTRVVSSELWVSSALVMAFGVFVTLSLQQTMLPFVLIAPLVTAVSVAFLFGSANEPGLEIELATAVSQRTILLARLFLLFSINLLFGSIGSLILALTRTDIFLWPLVASWLAPMTFLSALAFTLNVIFLETLLGTLISLILWGIQTVRQFTPTLTINWVLPDLLAANTQLWLWLVSILLVGLAAWWAGKEERILLHLSTS